MKRLLYISLTTGIVFCVFSVVLASAEESQNWGEVIFDADIHEINTDCESYTGNSVTELFGIESNYEIEGGLNVKYCLLTANEFGFKESGGSPIDHLVKAKCHSGSSSGSQVPTSNVNSQPSSSSGGPVSPSTNSSGSGSSNSGNAASSTTSTSSTGGSNSGSSSRNPNSTSSRGPPASRVAEESENPTKRDTFISYSRKDFRFVDHLEEALRRSSVTSWRDIRDGPAGPIVEIVSDAIKDCKIVLAILSSNSAQSKMVQYELDCAVKLTYSERKNVLVPIALDQGWEDFKLPVHIMEEIYRMNVLDFSNWHDAAEFKHQFARLVYGLERYY